jgi:hypothetical protein
VAGVAVPVIATLLIAAAVAAFIAGGAVVEPRASDLDLQRPCRAV